MSTPRISVVTANYNYAKYVVRAVDSVLSQDIGRDDVEVIVIDDASTDESWDVLQRYAGDPRVVLVRHEMNRGYVPTFNEAIRLSRGAYIVQLDSDDLALDDSALARQCRMFEANPTVGLVFCGNTTIGSGGEILGHVKARARSVTPALEAFDRMLLGNSFPNAGAAVRRRSLDSVGLYDESLDHSAKWELWLRLCARYDLGYIDRALYGYRVHGLNMHLTAHADQEISKQTALVSRVIASASMNELEKERRRRRAVAAIYELNVLARLAEGRLCDALGLAVMAARLDPTILRSLPRGLSHFVLRLVAGRKKTAVTRALRRLLHAWRRLPDPQRKA